MKTLSIVIATAILSFGLAGAASMTQAWLGAKAPYLTSQSLSAPQPEVKATQSPISDKRIMLALHCYDDNNPECL